MMKTMMYKKTSLAVALSTALFATAMPAVAQDSSAEEQEVEQIVVTGIRGSLIRSMDIKRSSIGVVDAISAEEMGKFPDTNLAESLQRITGVSVSRANGEGSQITVRGFGPEFNLVTLNGRQMPSNGFSRSFDFANLSSEGVSSLELYKSARADVPSGGLGATVNIITSKPLQQPGTKVTLVGKGMMETSNEVGDDVTPVFAGLFSKTFNDDRFGISANFSYQQRDFQKQTASIQGWQANVALPDIDPSLAIDARARDADGELLTNFMAPDENGDLQPTAAHFFPKDMNYGIEDFSRERLNSQVTVQYALTDAMVLTADYTTTDVTTGRNSIGWGIWNNFGANINSYELDENGTAVFANISGDDASFTRSRDTTKFETRSFGVNFDWEINDSWSLTLDYHDSKSEVDNGADDGLRSSGQIILGSNALQNKTYDYRQGDIPQFEILWNNGTNEVMASELDSNFSQFLYTPGSSEIQQARLDVEWLPDFSFPLTVVRFGVDSIEQTLVGVDGWSGLRGGPGFNPSFTEIFPDGMFTRVDATGLLDEFSGGGENISPGYYWDYDFDEALVRQQAFITEELYGSNAYVVDPFYTRNTTSSVQEDTLSFYLSTTWEFDVGMYPVQLNAGVRYEETDVVSPSQSNIAQTVRWVAASEWITQFSGIEEVSNAGGYDLVLPAFDFKVDVTDELVARMSWGKSITRAPLGNLLGGLSLSGSPKIGSRTGSRGNTNLQPFQSNNFDVSFEYYYDEASYAAIGFFWKEVDDWIENSTVDVTFEGLHDVYLGQRWNQTVAELEGEGIQATDSAIYDRMVANGFADENGAIAPDPATDPLIVWRLSSPENVDERSTNGIEFAVQHLIQDTGFGVAVNATIVDGDVEYNPYVLTSQEALAGLSDSANFQVFYEDDDLYMKLTYAWRDEYLIGQGQAQGTSDVPPQFAKEYGQWDFSANYDVDERLTLTFEAINLNNATEEHFGRFANQFLFAAQYGPRYMLGVRLSLDD